MKEKIYYYTGDAVPMHDITIDNYISMGPEAKSKWWDSLPLLNLDSSSVKEWFDRALDANIKTGRPIDHPATIRTCPGISDLFKQSHIFKAPVDFLLKIEETGPGPNDYTYVFTTPAMATGMNERLLAVESHTPHQYTGSNSSMQIAKGMVNIKLMTHLKLYSKKSIQFIPVQPIYHMENVPYSVMPGIVTLNPGNVVSLNLNVLFPKKTATYEFHADQPLMYLTFLNTDKPSFEQVKRQPFTRKHWFGDLKRQMRNNI